LIAVSILWPGWQGVAPPDRDVALPYVSVSATDPEERPPRRFGDRLSLQQYARFLLVGLVVGVIAVILRELISRALPADTPAYYSLSVIVVYAAGILLSFALHSRYTFGVGPRVESSGGLVPFTAVALVGALATWLVSLLFRYGLGFDRLFGDLSGSAAFAVGAVSASLLTYSLNAHMVFHRRQPTQDHARNRHND
jgi:putative flippase GtrA